MEGQVHSAVSKGLLIAPFVERFNKCYGERIPDKFYQYLEQLA